jgi:class 3 adenylate cyclase
MLEKGKRILAAIMFTDMVGYTALTQVDEIKSKEFRDRHRKVLEETTDKHNGKTLQYWGDGTLTIFDSAVEAVQCAVDIQRELQKEPKIPLRIGIHVGDIVYDDEGIYGDGVNLASRLESLSISGGVLISYKVNDEIKNQRNVTTQSMGEYELKNVKDPMEVYALTNEGLIIPKPDELKKKSKKKKNKSVYLFTTLAAIIILLFLLFQYGGFFNTKDDESDNEIQVMLSPVEEVKSFINDVGTGNLKSAFNRHKNELWTDYNKFSTNEFFGGIDSSIVNNYSLKTSDSLEAVVYVEYSLYCEGNRNGKYEQNFLLTKFDTAWKIIDTEDISLKVFDIERKTSSKKTVDKKDLDKDNLLKKRKIRENLIKKTKIRREKIKRKLDK